VLDDYDYCIDMYHQLVLLPFSMANMQVLDESEVDSLAIVAVAGIAAEGQQYEEVGAGGVKGDCLM
jgi:hypothetical protein